MGYPHFRITFFGYCSTALTFEGRERVSFYCLFSTDGLLSAGNAVIKGPGRVHCPALCPNNDTPRPALTSRCYPLCNGRQPPFPCLLLCHTRTASTLLPAVCQYLSLSSPARCPSALRQRPTAPHLLCTVSLEAVTPPPPAQTHVGICCCCPVNRIGYVHQSKLALSYIIIV